ncbi:MAG: polyprenol monophosphomannose synthase [Nitrososphaerales archaeon]
MSVAVILPTYNERENIAPLFERLASIRPSLGMDLHLLFVDDGSPDGTAAEISKLVNEHDYVHLLEREGKMGLGTAYLDGFRRAIEIINPAVFVQMDSDLQHPPERVRPLVEAVVGGADVAVGSRYVEGGSFEGLKGSRKMVSRGANWLARSVLGLSVHDTTTGFKALDRRAVDTILNVRLHSRGFIFQVESLYVFKENGLKMVEVPFVFELRERGASKMSDKEVWEFLRSVVAMRFRDYRKTGSKG